MNEMTPQLPQQLQKALAEYYASPGPSAEFAASLEATLRQRMKITQQSQRIQERNSFMKLVQTRPLAAILIALIVLLVLSGVAYALGRVFGYIPGIGMVEQTSTMRTIEAPIPLERDGIRLTIENVIASSTSTSIRFQVEWLTPAPSAGDFDTGCQGTPTLLLSDGSLLNLTQALEKFSAGGTGPGYGYVMEFAPIPTDQTDVTFLYPCLVPLAPGSLPRDWRISFRLIPAPQGTILPVVTVPATESPAFPATQTVIPSAQVTPVADHTHRIAMSVDSFVPLDDGNLLMGSMQWSANDHPAFGVRPVPYMGYVSVIDANGQDVAWEEVYGNAIPRNEEYRSYWGVKILSKTFASPLTITMNAVDLKFEPVTFHFDVGTAPQAGQSWDINQDIQIVDSLAHVVKAELIAVDGNLNFQLDVQVDSSMIGDIYINTPLNQCMGGGGGYPTEHLDTLQVWVPMCRPDLPPGTVEMQVTGAVLWGEWQANWQP